MTTNDIPEKLTKAEADAAALYREVAAQLCWAESGIAYGMGHLERAVSELLDRYRKVQCEADEAHVYLASRGVGGEPLLDRVKILVQECEARSRLEDTLRRRIAGLEEHEATLMRERDEARAERDQAFAEGRELHKSYVATVDDRDAWKRAADKRGQDLNQIRSFCTPSPQAMEFEPTTEMVRREFSALRDSLSLMTARWRAHGSSILRIAEAAGIVYVADYHNPTAGNTDEIVAGIERLQKRGEQCDAIASKFKRLDEDTTEYRRQERRLLGLPDDALVADHLSAVNRLVCDRKAMRSLRDDLARRSNGPRSEEHEGCAAAVHGLDRILAAKSGCEAGEERK